MKRTKKPKKSEDVKSASTQSVLSKTPQLVPIPVRELEGVESLTMGFRMDHVSCERGTLFSGAGLGSPWISVQWGEKWYAIHGVELLKAIAALCDPEGAKLIPSPAETHQLSVTAGAREIPA